MKKSILFLIAVFAFVVSQSQKPANSLVIYSDSGKVTIDKNIYGHFAEHLGRCIYDGIWVGPDSPIPNTRGIRNDVIEALKEISPPVIRWPGGCFADIYHWKNGIGPREERPEIVNLTWGAVVEDNSFGTHEFLDFCDLIGAEPYLAANVGSGSVQETRDWVAYVNSEKGPMADLRRKNGRDEPWNVKYWGIGNESWGCGGNMTPEYYADQAKQFATFCPGDFKIFSGGLPEDYYWTETVMKKTQYYQHLIQGYSYHHYTVPNTWNEKGSATNFNKEEWFKTMKKSYGVKEGLAKHCEIMDKYDPEKKIALIADEWGNWFDVEPGTNPAFLYQQNTLRDAVTAGLYFNIFNNRSDRVKMANIAQTVNVLQAVILTKEDQMVKTPTFYAFKMFKVHHDATLLPFELQSENYFYEDEKISSLSVSASKDKEGKIHVSIVNLDPDNKRDLICDIKGANLKSVSAEIITARDMNAFNDFNSAEQVNIKEFKDFKMQDDKLNISLPAKSVVMVEID
ncbi:MAG: alpha-N-arabinofuranosidase [Bacteroidales bacterium]